MAEITGIAWVSVNDHPKADRCASACVRLRREGSA
jgi:hypothetical protein